MGGLVLVVCLVMVGCGGNQLARINQLSPDQLLQIGLEEFEQGDWDDAILYLEQFVFSAPTHPRYQEAQYRLAEARFNKDEYVTAAAEFNRFASQYADGELGDDARFMVCRSYWELSPDPPLDQEYTEAAIDHCGSLLAFYPESEYADRAREILDAGYNKLAEKLYRSGSWYMRRGAIDSAILYFEDIVARYPRTPLAPRALFQMLEGYGLLGYEEEANETRQRLLTEYPESPEARQLQSDPPSVS